MLALGLNVFTLAVAQGGLGRGKALLTLGYWDAVDAAIVAGIRSPSVVTARRFPRHSLRKRPNLAVRRIYVYQNRG